MNLLLVLTASTVSFVHAQKYDSCECIPYYLCKNGTVSTSGESIIDIRMGGNETNKKCNDYLDTCCGLPDKLKEEDLTTRSVKYNLTRGCGYRNPDGVGFRIQGNSNNEAEFGEFPWMVAILIKKPNSTQNTYTCGGSLIHPQVVLTAAHCLKETRGIYVRAGEWDSITEKELYKHQERKAVSATLHPKFNRGNLFNDVALLYLESPFEISQFIDVACLPLQNAIFSDNCFVTGWGKKDFESNIYQNILKKVELPMMEHQKCEEAFKGTRLGRLFKLHESFVCAGGEGGKDACTGDGGGPLVCPISGKEDRYQQVGIVAWGIGCGTPGVPGAYVNVALFRNWIDENMKRHKYDISKYVY